MTEFILEDGKLVTDGISWKKIPTDMNLRTVNRSLGFQRMIGRIHIRRRETRHRRNSICRLTEYCLI